MSLRRTRVDEVQELLASLGVSRGDTVMVHSAVFTLGVVEDGLDGLYRAFRKLLGDEGTLIVPTFTYSFRRDQVFDVRCTSAPTALGAFSEHVRQMPDAVRSTDPLFSMAALGPKAGDLMERTSHNCFGPRSIYERLFQADVLFLALGITYSTGLACFMHLERVADVDYRREVRFDGRSVGYDGRTYDDWAMHFGRDEGRYPGAKTNRDALGCQMEQIGISRAANFGSGHHMGLRARPFSEYVLSELARDPHTMLTHDPEYSARMRAV